MAVDVRGLPFGSTTDQDGVELLAKSSSRSFGRGVVVAEMVTQILLLPLMVYAACGLILSLAVHLMALAGLQPPGGNALFFGLHVGIFPLWLPVVLIMMKLTRG